MKTIIGIFAKMSSGKDTVAEYLIRKHGFKKISYSENMLRPIINSCEGRATRENYIHLGRTLKEFQPAILSYLAHGFIMNSEHIIIDISTI